MPQAKTQKLNFEKALHKLDNIVEKMEAGNLSLEESLKSFETGVGLVQDCQKALKTAEQKIKILTQAETLKDFNDKDD